MFPNEDFTLPGTYKGHGSLLKTLQIVLSITGIIDVICKIRENQFMHNTLKYNILKNLGVLNSFKWRTLP